MKIEKSDVLVIGSGGAGLRAAIEAHDHGAEVIILSKSLLGKAHTVMAEGGVAAALGNVEINDNWKIHFKDTMVEGQLIANWEMVLTLVKEVQDRVKELEGWGAIFDRTEDGKISQRSFGAHTYNRVCYIGDRIGLEILHTLEDQIISRDIKIMDEVIVTKILKNNEKIVGVIGLDLKKGEFFVIKTKAIILATGGAGRLYKITTNSWETTGHGYALALNSGAELQDMEMIQFHPTGMVWPESIAGMLVTEAVRGEGGILLNNKNERFMEKYDPKRLELGPRDLIARAVYTEIKEGRGTEHKGVWLDITHKPRDNILKKLPRMYDQFKTYANVDITKEKMEVAPTAHYTMGGIRTNINCTTSVLGLFVCGEISSGVHGANRLGGNSLADILVFGRRAGKSAAEYIKKLTPLDIKENEIKEEIKKLESYFKQDGENPLKLKELIQELMWGKVGISRTKKDLEEALHKINEIKKIKIHVDGSMQYNHSFIDAIQLPSMLTVCEVIIKSALLRTESRGAHFREDFPKRNDKEWLKNIICKKFNDNIILEKVDVPKIPKEYMGLLE